MADGSPRTDTSTDATEDRNLRFQNNQLQVTVVSDGSDKSRDQKTLRRLAQNREAARKSRLRKKAYVQQLESSRMKLTQLEQELQRARQQGYLFQVQEINLNQLVEMGKAVTLSLGCDGDVIAYGTIIKVYGLGETISGMELPEKCVGVSIDEVVDDKAPLPIPTDDYSLVYDALGTHVAWPVHLVHWEFPNKIYTKSEIDEMRVEWADCVQSHIIE